MKMQSDPAVEKMLALIAAWEEAADQRSVFLRCYSMMTINMLEAIPGGQFQDAEWVNQLLHRFADYYFLALEAYEQAPRSAPLVWQMTHNSSREEGVSALQKMLLGVNAHINYDLVFTLVDVLEADWARLSEPNRSSRYADHCAVNRVIGQTIDAVQDQVLEPAMPWMEAVDSVLGRVDEWMISSLISGWRESVWNNAVRMLEAQDEQRRSVVGLAVERSALRRARAIRAQNWVVLLKDIQP